MDNLTIIFTVRVDSEERKLNILSTLKYYSSILPHSHIILLEADVRPNLDNFMRINYVHVKYIFVEDHNPIFHRTHYINEELRLVTTPNAAIIDSDVVIPIPQLFMANNILTETDACMVLPYDGRFVGLDQYFSDKFRGSTNIDSLLIVDGEQHLMFGFVSVGGAFMVNVERYKRLGWENENFPGWGPEDFERVNRLSILGYNPIRITGKIYHLDHPRGVNSSNGYEPITLATKREFCKVCSMMPDELRLYINTWDWIK